MRLARDGARVAIAYRSNKGAAQLALRQMQAMGADCVAVEPTSFSRGAPNNWSRRSPTATAASTSWVNNVGDFKWTLAESSFDEWENIFNLNLMTVMN